MDDNEDVFRTIIDDDMPKLKKLLAAGRDVNAKAAKGKTNYSCLHCAASMNSAEAAKILLDHGATVDIEDEYGNTPLWTAVFNYRGDGAVVELLLSKGADKNHQNHAGKSPEELAHLIANYDVKKYFAAQE